MYCGNASKLHVDHVFPLASMFPRRPACPKRLGVTAISCQWCNVGLGSKGFDTFADRCEYANGTLCRKYKNLINTDPWDDEELAEIKGTLRQYVETKNAERSAVADLVEWYGSDSFYKNLSDLCTEPSLDKASPLFSDVLHDYFAPVLGITSNLRE